MIKFKSLEEEKIFVSNFDKVRISACTTCSFCKYISGGRIECNDCKNPDEFEFKNFEPINGFKILSHQKYRI